MPTPHTRIRVIIARAAALCVALQGALSASTPQTAPRTEHELLRAIETIESEQAAFSPDLIPPLLELGRLYTTTGRCPDSIQVLNQALEISRRVDGLFDSRQMEVLEPLIDCYVALDLHADVDGELQRLVLLNESTYGKNNPRILPGLQHIAQWYEQAGYYLTARKLYSRAIDILRKAAKETASEAADTRNNPGRDVYDLLMVEPLRGIARAYRLEYQHGLEPVDAARNSASPLRSKAQLQGPYIRLDDLGGRSLERAVEILRGHSDAQSDSNRRQRIDTLLDLGDWYQMADASRNALKVYKEAWTELSISEAPDTPSQPTELGIELLSEPTPILYRPQIGIALRHTPAEQQKREYQQYSVDLDYTVTREGRVTDVVVTESNAPKDLQYHLAESLKRTRYRPRFLNGEPTDTRLHYRQKLYVAN